MPVCRKCGERFPVKYRDDNGVKHNFQQRRYCISCSPLHSHNTRKLEITQSDVINRKCLFCDNKAGRRRRLCGSCATKVRKFRVKVRAIALKGGKCEDCGWKGHLAGFQFHHVNGVKDFEIGHSVRRWDVVEKELDKCILLCARCHRIRHCNATESLLKYVGAV